MTPLGTRLTRVVAPTSSRIPRSPRSNSPAQTLREDSDSGLGEEPDPILAVRVAVLLDVTIDQAKAKLSAALKSYQADWIVQAVGVAEHRKKAGWDFILGVLKNWKAEGGPTPPRPKKVQPATAPPPKEIPPPPLTAAEITDLVNLAMGRSSLAGLVRASIQDAVRKGEIPAEAVPAELLVAGEKTPTAGSLAKAPPQSVGRTISGPFSAPECPSAPRRTRTYNPLIKSQLLCQLS